MYFVVIFLKFSPVFSFKFSFKIRSFPKKIEFSQSQAFWEIFSPGHQNINITSSIYAKITFGTPYF